LTYGQGDTTKIAFLIAWVDELLQASANLYLKARVLEVRLAINYYEAGDYNGGVEEARRFLRAANDAVSSNPSLMNELTNAQLGVIQSTLSELLVTEASVTGQFEESKKLLERWLPLNPANPSMKERITLGIRSRILGKLSKDHGDWSESAAQLRDFLDNFAAQGSQTEGWAAGDLAHVLMELGRVPEAEDVLRQYLHPRQINQTPQEREIDRRSDTLYLEMLLGESLLRQNRVEESEDTLQGLLHRLQNFGTLWHFEKFRVMFILTSLARLRQTTGRMYAALKYWKQALDYCENELNTDTQRGKWGSDTFIPLVIILSMSECYYELGNREHALEMQQNSLNAIDTCVLQRWVLGLGTYWLDWLKERSTQRSFIAVSGAGSRSDFTTHNSFSQEPHPD
jgi:tetratricopeptide (TPR) repeat protein